MRLILTISFILTTLCSIAGGLDSTQTMMLNKKPITQEINLKLKTHNSQLKYDGYITAVGGLMFVTAGVLLENKRNVNKIPDGYHGYSKSKDIAFNYSLMSLGAAINITGIIMIIKSYK